MSTIFTVFVNDTNPLGWAIIPAQVWIPGINGARDTLKMPPVARGSKGIDWFNNFPSWYSLIPPAIIVSSRGWFKTISISYLSLSKLYLELRF